MIHRHIISDFLEVNADILQEEAKSPYPKFIAKMIGNHHRKKLIKVAKKIIGSNHTLDRDNISEYFITLYNNFPPDGAYGIVTNVGYYLDGQLVQGNIYVENVVKGTIDINYDREKMHIDLLNLTNNESYDLEIENLSCPRIKNLDSILKKVNDLLSQNIQDYIISFIRRYSSKESGYVKRGD